MSDRFLKQLTVVVVVVLCALLQKLPNAAIFGIKPNLSLALFIALSFIIIHETIWFGAIVVLNYFLLRTQPIIDWPVLIFLVLILAGYGMARLLPWQQLINIAFLVAIITGVFYLIITPSFALNTPALLLGEVLYNLILGIIFYEIGKRQIAF